MKVASKEVRPKDNVEEPPALVEDHQPWKGEEVPRFCLVQVNRWESWVNTLKRDYQQNSAGNRPCRATHHDGSRRAEHADRLQKYAQVKEKMVVLLDARCRLHDPHAKDVGYAG